MIRILLVVVFMSLVSCMPYESLIPEQGDVVNSTDTEGEQGIANEITFESSQDSSIKKVNSNLVNGTINDYANYRISAGDQLDLFLSIKTKQEHAEYEVMAGDTIVVNFLHAHKFDQSYEVGSDGNITLPIVGEYDVAGKTVMEIQKDLTMIYSKIFKHPDVMVLIPGYLNKIHQLKLELQAVASGIRRSVIVKQDGYTFFPLLGKIQVDAKTIDELSKELNLEYSKINQNIQAHLFLNKF
ncbi:MAG: polysaccharide biosynthesis/export family protein [Methylococcaceae bacterium]